MNDLRYPIGRPEGKQQFTPDERRELIEQILAAPARLREAATGLSEKQLDSPYRDGGWSVRQVVHHVPDSHLNAYIRTKLALTENEPTIKPYDESAWAMLADSRDTPVEVSLTMLDAIHTRWLTLLRSMSDADFARTFRHPEHGVRTLDWLLGLYAWHGRHHTAHITALRERNGW
jgi:uncharacterized damage-inducible protein DinB